MILWVLLAVLVLAAVMGPAWWVRRVMQRYSEPGDRYAFTGGQFARELLNAAGLADVGVEAAEREGDHYDPRTRTVRLAPERYSGRSLAAITVAAHEVGHAIQHRTGFPPLVWRTRLVGAAQSGERIATMLLFASPLLAAFARSPGIAMFGVAAAVGSMLMMTLIHLITLPTEYDASFRRALPILSQAEVLHEGDLVHAKKLLHAAALTYVAGTLGSLLNLGRWIAILRR